VISFTADSQVLQDRILLPRSISLAVWETAMLSVHLSVKFYVNFTSILPSILESDRYQKAFMKTFRRIRTWKVTNFNT